MTGEWSGRRVQQARAVVATWLPAPCGRCGQPVELGSEWVVGHIVSRAERPDLTWVVSNWQPEHRGCSDRTGQAEVIARAQRQVLDAVGAGALADLDGALFPITEAGGKPPPLPFSPPEARLRQAKPVEVRDGLDWSPDTMRNYPWLSDFAEVPPDAAPPLWMSAPAEDAICSYGWESCPHLEDGHQAVPWIERVERKRLRWWQRLAIVRQLEHRDDGTLVYRDIIESAPRRAGKSVRVRGVALWRMSHADLFGEVQTVMHTGKDVAICREIQRGAWRWATEDAGWSLTKGNGKECLETPDLDRWLVRAQDAVYGYDVTLAAVDEGWDVAPGTVTEGLEPAMLERLCPQLHLTSTAHRRATSLMRGKLSTALSIDDGRTLLLVWAAPIGSDPSDPAVWRNASPHWTEDRRRLIEAKFLAAQAGQVDPEADDPDPMAGFTAQYLNIWRLTGRVETSGTPLIDEDDWHQRTALHEDRAPDGAGLESWFSAGTSLVLAWREGDGVILSASSHRDVAGAVTALRQSGFRGRVAVGKSLAEDPALKRVSTTPTTGRAGTAVADLSRLIGEDRLWHDGGAHLTGQVLEVRTLPSTDGQRVTSRGRNDALKAAAWAATAARSKPARRPRGVVLPSNSA